MKQARYKNRLKNGQPVCSSVFTWMSGVVVDEPSSGIYKVKVDEDVEHHSEHIYISEDEIITIRDEAIESAEYELEFEQHRTKRAEQALKHAQEAFVEAIMRRDDAERRLTQAKKLPA